jgi:hypothetical protein
VNDFVRIMEKESGLQLDWYKQYFVYSTKHIDYGIDTAFENNSKTIVRLQRIDNMPMPIDLLITGKDGKKVMHYVPMSLMFGSKPNEDNSIPRVVHDYWPWTNRTYDVEVNMPLSEIAKIEIDPSERMADVNRGNNVLNK